MRRKTYILYIYYMDILRIILLKNYYGAILFILLTGKMIVLCIKLSIKVLYGKDFFMWKEKLIKT